MGKNKFIQNEDVEDVVVIDSLVGKRLLYLGGIKRAQYVVERAKELGIYVVVADYNEDSPAKKVADEGVLVDAMDVDALVMLCKEKNIDGIMTGYADILMPICKKVASIMGFSCYYTDSLLRASTDKTSFKELCNMYDVPVPSTYSVDSLDYKAKALSIDYPVFIKPSDASGSRGANACYCAEEFVRNYEYALKFSKKGSVVVEELLQGTEFILDYLIVNGNPYLLSFADRYTSDKTRIAINSPNLMILPSKYLEQYKETVDKKVCKLLKECGIKDGLVFFQGYASPTKIVFYEMGCRLGGTWPYIDEYFLHMNPLDMLFNQALNDKMIDPKYEKQITPFFSGFAGIVYFLSNKKEGVISETKGIEQLDSMPGVVNVMIFYNKGDSFNCERQTDVRFLSVHVVANTISELEKRINDIYSCVDYLDAEFNSLLQPNISMSDIVGYY